MKISFLGATKIVTGSNFLIETKNTKFLIDCGMFQGNKSINRMNYEPFGFDPKKIDFMVLSHAHIDHSGRIPKLVKEGFNGDIYCTKATADLCSIMLPDSGHIQEMENEWDNRKRKRSGEKLREPLYTVKEAEESLRYFRPVLYDQKIEVNEEIVLRFRDAGHILGSSIIELWIKEDNKKAKLVFSGDLGRKDRPILRDPSLIEETDYLIIESTYGNRLHPPSKDDAKKLISIINTTARRGGNVVIPSFAVERAQDIIYELNKYYTEYIKNEDQGFLKVPVYIDSPLTVSATEIFLRNPDCFDEESLKLIKIGNNPLDFPNLKFTKTTEESKQLNIIKESKVIISASGMCTAGRIKHHLKHNLWRRESSIVFVGYQAEGTLGRRIKEGEKVVKIFGEEIRVNAEIYSLEGFSGHADRDGLMWWMRSFKNKPKKIFIVHGEEQSTKEISKRIEEELKIKTHIPELGESLFIEGENVLPGRKLEINRRSKEYIKIEENTEKLKSIFWPTLQKLRHIIDNGANSEELIKIENKLIELQKNILDLNMMLAEVINKEKDQEES
ncbi:MAG TPA: MBL fold metallo-hydrolase [Candidatus Atribacteria bacterium]|nr:MBL fold metallo-hydrolase [Candidatus Atribacteria bacterium]